VLPSSQRSWIGNAYEIKRVIDGSYYDPKTGNKSDRPIGAEDYVLLEGTPSTCANVALHNLYPGEIDLVITGPNFGRNSSTAFTLSRYGTGNVSVSLAL
jgi:tubulin--tyrosine ligase